MPQLSSTSKAPSRRNDLKAMPQGYAPKSQDVICAKGLGAKNHPGNKLLRALIAAHLDEYKVLDCRADRAFIVSTVANQIKKQGGRFVRQDKKGGGWSDIGVRNSREKIGATFRDLLHDQYKSSAKAKAIRRKQENSQAVNASSPADETGTTAPTQGQTSTTPVDPPAAVTNDPCRVVSGEPAGTEDKSKNKGDKKARQIDFDEDHQQLKFMAAASLLILQQSKESEEDEQTESEDEFI